MKSIRGAAEYGEHEPRIPAPPHVPPHLISEVSAYSRGDIIRFIVFQK